MDGEKRYALKIERRRDVRSVKQEFKVLKKIQERSPSLVCTVHACGTFEDRFFMIMELLGNNVAEARKGAGGRFDLATVRRLATSMLRGLEEVHAAGFVHRDVKPANFAVGPAFADPLTGVWKVIDFGLARRYLDDAGDVLPERTDTSFRGSTTYASVHAHAEQDLGRRDDLWSWLYCTIELLEGTLPWRTDQNKDPDSREAVLRLKQACIADPSRYLRTGGGGLALPPGASGPQQQQQQQPQGPHPLAHLLLGPVQQLSNYIASLGFIDAPDYGLLYSCLAQLPDDLQGLMPGPGPGSLAAAWGVDPAAAGAQYGQPYGSSQQQQHAMYQHQYYAPQQQLPPPGLNPSGPAGFWGAARGGWGDPAMYAEQHHQLQQQQQQQQQQQHVRYGHHTGGPPPPPDPGRSPQQENTHTASPPLAEYGGSGGAGGQEPPPPLPPGQGPPAAGLAPAPLADVSAELADAMLAEALAERAGPEGGRESSQVAEVQEYVDLVKQGQVSDEAHDVACRLMGLEPVEALATIAYVVDALAAHTAPASANTAAVVLSALGAYARDAARRTMTKYCRVLAAQHQPQLSAQQQQQQGQGQQNVAPGPPGQLPSHSPQQQQQGQGQPPSQPAGQPGGAPQQLRGPGRVGSGPGG